MGHLFQIIVFTVRVKFTAELFLIWTEFGYRNETIDRTNLSSHRSVPSLQLLLLLTELVSKLTKSNVSHSFAHRRVGIQICFQFSSKFVTIFALKLVYNLLVLSISRWLFSFSKQSFLVVCDVK